jgi:DNA primase
MRIDAILSRLHKVKRTASGFMACCPAHEDRNPSLSVSQGQDGRILLKCWAGCSIGDICGALGIKVSDLFSDRIRKGYKQWKR